MDPHKKIRLLQGLLLGLLPFTLAGICGLGGLAFAAVTAMDGMPPVMRNQTVPAGSNLLQLTRAFRAGHLGSEEFIGSTQALGEIEGLYGRMINEAVTNDAGAIGHIASSVLRGTNPSQTTAMHDMALLSATQGSSETELSTVGFGYVALLAFQHSERRYQASRLAFTWTRIGLCSPFLFLPPGCELTE